MKNWLLVLFVFLQVGCVSNSHSILPEKESSVELGANFPKEIKLYLTGKKTFQDMTFEAQKYYMYHQSEIEILKILEGSQKISSDQIMMFLKMRNPSEIATAIKADQKLPDNQKEKLALDIVNIKPSVPTDIDIVQLPDQTKGKQVAGKLSWEQESKQWIKQVVLYNDARMPSIDHPVWNYTSSLIPPERVGRRPWEPYAYKLFNN